VNAHAVALTRAAVAGVLAAATSAAPAAGPAIFEGADLALGSKLIADNKCTACHIRQVGGDGTAIYRPQGRINTPGALRGMVDYCSTELNLGLFPEEVTAIAAVLQRDHYRFGASVPTR
jgi:hypothetical protein